MEHDARCEARSTMGVMRARYGTDDGDTRLMLNALAASDQICACVARSWGLEVELSVGLRIGRARAERWIGAWQAADRIPAAQRVEVLAGRLVAKLNGRNVIRLQDHRDARRGDCSGG